MFCTKHGEYGAHAPMNVNPYGNVSLGECPRCKAVRETGLCQECEEHKASETFSEGSIAYVHGIYERLCQCCVLKRWEKTLANLTKEVEVLKDKIAKKPCSAL